jgi:hypothetical protein
MPYFIMVINVGLLRVLGQEDLARLPGNRDASGEITINGWLFHHLLFVGSPSVIRQAAGGKPLYF